MAAYHLVNTGGDLLVNAVELAGIDHYIDVAQIMLVRHVADLFHQAGQRSDALVQVLLNDIEVTMVGVADLRRQIALAEYDSRIRRRPTVDQPPHPRSG